MSDEKTTEGVERYTSKLYKYSTEHTWKFSKQQYIVDGLVAIGIAIIGYYVGIVTSFWTTALAIVAGYTIAVIVTFVINLIRAPAGIDRERQAEIARLRNQVPADEHRTTPAVALPARNEVAPRYNLVCTAAGGTFVDIDRMDGSVTQGTDHIALVAEFVNQPNRENRIEHLRQVFATIRFFDEGGLVCERVHHGLWVGEEWRSVDFLIGDVRRLVLAVQVEERGDFDERTDSLRAIENNHENADRYNEHGYLYLPYTVSRADVQLFSARDGSSIGEFSFQINIAEGIVVMTAGERGT